MFTFHFSLKVGRVVSFGLAAVIFAVSAPSVFGYVSGISGNVGPTMAYQGTPDFMWNMAGGPLSDGSIGFSGGGGPWSIAPSWSSAGALDWSAALALDQSSGGLAKGTFQPGGTFKFSGKVFASNAAGSTLLYEGLIFQGEMQDFGIAESSTNMNRINLFTPPGSLVDSMAVVLPNGGWLYDEGLLAPFYLFSFMSVDCRQDGGPLVDFQSDIVTYAVMQFTMIGVPEPTAVVVFGAACLLLVRRRWPQS